VLVVALGLLLLASLHLSSRWALFAGVFFGMGVMVIRALPEVVMPSHIFNWQHGAWGEQMTASELRKLPRSEWCVRHDLRWGRGNHDHIVAGTAIFVLNSKYHTDSRIEIEGKALRVTRLDDPDNSYLADRWLPSAEAEARFLERKLGKELGFGVAVYPVIVLWGEFDLEEHWIGNVFVLNGHVIADWIRGRPRDLVNDEKRRAVADYVRAMPRA
jgi:hypothetical protein